MLVFPFRRRGCAERGSRICQYEDEKEERRKSVGAFFGDPRARVARKESLPGEGGAHASGESSVARCGLERRTWQLHGKKEIRGRLERKDEHKDRARSRGIPIISIMIRLTSSQSLSKCHDCTKPSLTRLLLVSGPWSGWTVERTDADWTVTIPLFLLLGASVEDGPKPQAKARSAKMSFHSVVLKWNPDVWSASRNHNGEMEEIRNSSQRSHISDYTYRMYHLAAVALRPLSTDLKQSSPRKSSQRQAAPRFLESVRQAVLSMPHFQAIFIAVLDVQGSRAFDSLRQESKRAIFFSGVKDHWFRSRDSKKMVRSRFERPYFCRMYYLADVALRLLSANQKQSRSLPTAQTYDRGIPSLPSGPFNSGDCLNVYFHAHASQGELVLEIRLQATET
ncbi:hypothetical protein DFH09DRAFT_1098643 [Mycena vulgaris]|nr:hypothetical protein DFH09DRAFT_1098643 [Mycena vulgaris]